MNIKLRLNDIFKAKYIGNLDKYKGLVCYWKVTESSIIPVANTPGLLSVDISELKIIDLPSCCPKGKV